MYVYRDGVLQLDRNLPGNPVVPKLKTNVDQFKQFMPVVVDLRNQALKQRHWERIQEIIGQRIVRDKNLTMGSMLNDLKVSDFREEIGNVSAAATRYCVVHHQHPVLVVVLLVLL